MGLGSKIKLTSTVERHTACSSDIVVLQALLLDKLLSGEITSCKENSSRHALSEQRTGCEPSIVPDAMVRTNQVEDRRYAGGGKLTI